MYLNRRTGSAATAQSSSGAPHSFSGESASKRRQFSGAVLESPICSARGPRRRHLLVRPGEEPRRVEKGRQRASSAKLRCPFLAASICQRNRESRGRSADSSPTLCLSARDKSYVGQRPRRFRDLGDREGLSLGLLFRFPLSSCVSLPAPQLRESSSAVRLALSTPTPSPFLYLSTSPALSGRSERLPQ